MLGHYSKLETLREAAQGLAPVGRYSPWVRALWQTIKSAVEEMLSQVEELSGGPQEARDLAAAFADQEDILLPLLGLIEAGEAVRVPHAMIEPLRGIAAVELGEPVTLALTYQWVPSNYTVRGTVADDLREVLELIYQSPEAEAVKKVPSTLAVLSVPAGQTESVPEHAALFHEVGHIVTRQPKHFEQCAPWIAPSDEDVARITDIQAQRMGHAPSDRTLEWGRIHTEVRERLLGTAARWVWECLSDAWATRTAGPSPLLALRQSGAVDPPSDTHPPTWTRSALMRACLERAGFASALDDPEFGWLAGALADFDQAIATQREGLYPSENTDPVYDYLVHRIEQATDSIVSHFYSAPGAYLAQDWVACRVEHLETGQELHPFVVCLLNYVPPHARPGHADVQKPLIASILNAGWNTLADARHWGSFCKGLGLTDISGQHEARKRLNRLLLKGMEVCQLAQSTVPQGVRDDPDRLADTAAHGR